MVFKCQEDSFLKEYSSNVVSCEKTQFKSKDENIIDGYNVILENTILFPEGGGQPCDTGFLDEKPVLNVTRAGDQAIHFVQSNEPFEIGQTVSQKIDWDRREDHMQQHSGQHLITAVFYNDYGLTTTAWWLGAEVSYLELDTKVLTQEQVVDVEKKVNRFITNGVNVSVITIENSEQDIPPQVTRAMKGLPKDHVGAVRVINIDGIDSNLCCGTHVTNLSQLQMIKVLHIEKSKDRYLVYFLVGNRVLKKLKDSYAREQELNTLLNCGPPTHIEMVKKIKENVKNAQRSLQKVLKELAVEEARKVNEMKEYPQYYMLHRKDGLDSDFITVFLKHLKTENIFYFLITSNDFGKGHMVLKGKPNDISELGPVFCSILDGKGNGKNDRFQAKINNLKGIKECEKKMKEYFKN